MFGQLPRVRMPRINKTYAMLLMLAVIAGTFIQGGFIAPMSFGEYAAPAAWIHQGEQVILYGDVLFLNMSPAAGITLRLFATDELVGEHVTTDDLGRFVTSNTYEAGQYFNLWYEESRVRLFDTTAPDLVFVEYDASGDEPYYLGLFQLPV